jgi:hypothetical protein
VTYYWVVIGMTVLQGAHAAELPWLEVGAKGRHLTAGDRPFFWLADTAWWIVRRVGPEEQEEYLARRAAQGFNVIQVHCGFDRPDYAGNWPFADNDPARPNEAFWQHMDDFVARARAIESQADPDLPLARRTIRCRLDRPLPVRQPLKAWEFATGAEGWVPYHVAPPVVRGGVLRTRVELDDPQLLVDNVGVTVEDLQCLALRARVSPGIGSCQVYWSTAAEPALSGTTTFVFPLQPDGQWHEYQVSRRPQGSWRGTLKVLRLDIGAPGDRTELDWVRLYGKG